MKLGYYGSTEPAHDIRVVMDVIDERERQYDRWGQQDHPPVQWLAILMEEVGEVATEILECANGDLDWDAYRAELVQVAAVAVAAIGAFDRSRDA